MQDGGSRMEPKFWFVWSMIAVGVAAMLAALPLLSGRLPRGHWYGLKTTATLASDRTWHTANRLLGINLCIAGLATAGISGSMLLGQVEQLSEPVVGVYAIGGGAMCFAVAVGHALMNVARLK
ncbi:MAG: SdpI family protein [Planctomycetota bacterium]